MTSQKPYLLRAIYQWLVDNGCTPQIAVAYPNKGWVYGVPDRFLENEFLILNISPQASPDCVIEDDYIYFTARFNGESRAVTVAVEAVASIFAREKQEGMEFELSPKLADGAPKPVTDVQKKSEKTESKPHLKIIK